MHLYMLTEHIPQHITLNPLSSEVLHDLMIILTCFFPTGQPVYVYEITDYIPYFGGVGKIFHNLILLNPQIRTKPFKYTLGEQVSGEGSGIWSIYVTHEFNWIT